jgi:hypothetical protein
VAGPAEAASLTNVRAALAAAAEAIAARTWELSESLVDVLGVTDVGAYFPHPVTYHPTCHSLRLLRVGQRPLQLLRAVEGIDLVELPDAEQCCGFGGTFALKNPAVSSAMLPDPVPDDPPLDVAALDALDGVVTTCAVAIAETGTIVLDTGPGQGSRAFSLVPDYHLAVVRTGQIVAAVPDAVAALDPARPLTWLSGASATSDIELSRVEGVHGPRTLDIVIVAD